MLYPDDFRRHAVARLKHLETVKDPPYEMPPDSFIEDAVRDIFGELIECLAAAHEYIASATHEPGCRIVLHGCDCGSTEDSKVLRTEFYRRYNELQRVSKSAR